MPVPPPENAELKYDGKMAKAYEWPQTLYDGTVKTFECYVRQDTVAVIAFLDPEHILITDQEQPGRTNAFLDPPGGMVDPGETPEQSALRELREETGYDAAEIKLWVHRKYEGITRFEEFIYVAKDLKHVSDTNPEAAGERIRVIKMPWKEAIARSLKGEMRRVEVMLAILAMEFDPEAKARLDAFLSS